MCEIPCLLMLFVLLLLLLLWLCFVRCSVMSPSLWLRSCSSGCPQWSHCCAAPVRPSRVCSAPAPVTASSAAPRASPSLRSVRATLRPSLPTTRRLTSRARPRTARAPVLATWTACPKMSFCVGCSAWRRVCPTTGQNTPR